MPFQTELSPATLKCRKPGHYTLDMFAIAAQGSVRSMTLLRRIAYVDVNPQQPMTDTQFIEAAAVNRGMNRSQLPNWSTPDA